MLLALEVGALVPGAPYVIFFDRILDILVGPIFGPFRWTDREDAKALLHVFGPLSIVCV